MHLCLQVTGLVRTVTFVRKACLSSWTRVVKWPGLQAVPLVSYTRHSLSDTGRTRTRTNAGAASGPGA